MSKKLFINYLTKGNFKLEILANRILTREEILFASSIFLYKEGLRDVPNSGYGFVNYTL